MHQILRWNTEHFNTSDAVIVLILLSTMHFKLETKFTQMIKGTVVFIIIKKLTEILNFNVPKLIIEKIVSCGPIVGIVVFQQEIRNALQYLGRTIHLKKRRHLNSSLLCSMEKAMQYMAKRKIGCLITLERSMDLQEFIETGIRLNADVTGELLINIFAPSTPLHDGAVIIRNGKIVVASAYLPLTHSVISNKYGTRHRASLGVSEVSDSITVVVSEETGEISLAFEGVLLDNLTVEMCLQIVGRELSWM